MTVVNGGGDRDFASYLASQATPARVSGGITKVAMTPATEQLSLQLHGGAVIAALRRWAHGTVIGVEFVGALSFGEERAIRAALGASHPNIEGGQKKESRRGDSPSTVLPLNRLYPCPDLSGAGSGFHALAAAVVVSTMRCGEWCA
jgi:hypothetical protein